MSDRRENKTVWDWIGLEWKPDYNQLRPVGALLGWLMMLVAGAIVLIALGLLVAFGLAVYNEIGTGTAGKGDAIRNIGLALAAVFSAPFLVWRSFVAQRQADNAEKGLITDRINNAVENLGATRERRDADGNQVTEPNLEVRIGGLYALERLARDNLDYHIQIMEIITAYIRENARADDAEDSPRMVWEAAIKKAAEDNKDLEEIEKAAEAATGLTDKTSLEKTLAWVEALPPLRTDIQAALTILGRRNAAQRAEEAADTRKVPQGYRLDLRETRLQNADLARLDMSRANLIMARLEGATLIEAQLQGAFLTGAKLQGAVLWRAKLPRADLFMADLQGADLRGAEIDATTAFTKATTTGAAIGVVDLTDIALTDAQIADMFGDGSVILPKERRPAHWPSDELDRLTFFEEWHLYKSDPAAYIPPQDRPDPAD